MILRTRAAKIILLLLAAWLMGCAIVVAFTGWDGKSSPRIGTSASSPIAQTPSSSPSVEPPPAQTPPGRNTPEESEPRALPAPEPWSPAPSNAVYLSPRFQGARTGQEITFEVMVGLTDRGISGVEFEVAFPSEVLRARSLRPGDLLGSAPLIAADDVDNSSGTLHYASARKGATTAENSGGVLAGITFEVLPAAPAGEYPLTLRNVIVTDERFESLSGFDVLGVTFEVVE